LLRYLLLLLRSLLSLLLLRLRLLLHILRLLLWRCERWLLQHWRVRLGMR
jgi:hypothetical protein